MFGFSIEIVVSALKYARKVLNIIVIESIYTWLQSDV